LLVVGLLAGLLRRLALPFLRPFQHKVDERRLGLQDNHNALQLATALREGLLPNRVVDDVLADILTILRIDPMSIRSTLDPH